MMSGEEGATQNLVATVMDAGLLWLGSPLH